MNIKVDTVKLRAYADRLKNVNNRISRLDKQMNNLYLKVGLRDLFNLLRSDSLKTSMDRITNCTKYLNETANDFDTTEHSVAELF